MNYIKKATKKSRVILFPKEKKRHRRFNFFKIFILISSHSVAGEYDLYMFQYFQFKNSHPKNSKNFPVDIYI